MWYSIKNIKIQGENIPVLLFLDSLQEVGGDHIRIKAMINEYHIEDTVICGDHDRDFMYSLIENFPIKTLTIQIKSLAFDCGAIEKY